MVWGDDNKLVIASEAKQSPANVPRRRLPRRLRLLAMTFNPNQTISALVLVATALFLMTMAPWFPWRRQARIAALAIYGATLLGVVVYIALWLCGIVG